MKDVVKCCPNSSVNLQYNGIDQHNSTQEYSRENSSNKILNYSMGNTSRIGILSFYKTS